MRAIAVCVDYSDLLALTLPYNRHHFSEVWVVTSLTDHETMRVANDNRAHIVTTDAFHRDGAAFNKFLALEEGLDRMGREGLLVIMDADVIWPYSYQLFPLKPGNLYTPKRRMMTDTSKLAKDGLPVEETWRKFPLHPQQREWAGYTQIFHADDPHLGSSPWHVTDFTHAGGPDSFFQAKWPADNKLRPTFEVLHLGKSGENWCGRTSQMLDGTCPVESQRRLEQLRAFMTERRRTRNFDHEKLSLRQPTPPGD